MNAMPDLPGASQFLELLAAGEQVTFQTFDDSKAKRKNLIKILHGNLTKHGSTLESLNGRGAGAFVMVNAGDGKGRKSGNVLRVRATFVDLDGSPIDPVMTGPLMPHVTVESSSGRFHAYWLTEGIPLEEFRAVQEMLAYKFNGDPIVKDLPRVMRLPGFLHQKSAPFLTHVLQASGTSRYSRSELYDAFGFDPSVSDWKDSAPITEGQRNTTLFSMGRGFVAKGLSEKSVSSRLHKINERRCVPPLPESEVNEIVKQAVSYGQDGALLIDYRLLDSPEYHALSRDAKALDMLVRRITKGDTKVKISLLRSDLATWGFGNKKTLAKYRDELIENNFLVVDRHAKYGQDGETRECGLFRLAEFRGRNCPKR